MTLMKIFGYFRLRDTTLASAFLVTSCLMPFTLSAAAQDDTGNKPEMMAPMGQPAHASKPKVTSTSLTVTFADKTLNFSPAELATLPHETVTVINGHTKASETYTGVPIAVLLDKLGLPFTKPNEHTLLKTYFVAEGTDGYFVLISSYEALSAIRGQSSLVADTLNGKPLASDGAFKLVIPGDSRPQRWVQNLKSLTFKTVE